MVSRSRSGFGGHWLATGNLPGARLTSLEVDFGPEIIANSNAQPSLRGCWLPLKLRRVSDKNANTSEKDGAPGGSAAPEPTLLGSILQRRDSIVIGRGIDCDLVIRDAKASRRHCQLTRTEDGFRLEDLGSRNGTYVNGERITGSVQLKASGTFKIGDTMFYLS